MALVAFAQPKLVLSPTKSGTNTYVLPEASSLMTSAWTIQVVNAASLVVSITVGARSSAPAAGFDGDNVGFAPTLYRKLYLNGAAGDGSLVGTAITANSIIVVPSDGLQIALDVTYTSGTGYIYAVPRAGQSNF